MSDQVQCPQDDITAVLSLGGHLEEVWIEGAEMAGAVTQPGPAAAVGGEYPRCTSDPLLPHPHRPLLTSAFASDRPIPASFGNCAFYTKLFSQAIRWR